VPGRRNCPRVDKRRHPSAPSQRPNNGDVAEPFDVVGIAVGGEGFFDDNDRNPARNTAEQMLRPLTGAVPA